MRKSRPSAMHELAPAEAAGALRVGPGRGRRAEHRAFGLLHRLAGEEVVERVRHLQHDVLDPADARAPSRRASATQGLKFQP